MIKDGQSGPEFTSTYNLRSDIEELIKKATAFIAAYYYVKQMPEEIMKKNHVYSGNWSPLRRM